MSDLPSKLQWQQLGTGEHALVWNEMNIVAAVYLVDGRWMTTVNEHRPKIRRQARAGSLAQGRMWVERWASANFAAIHHQCAHCILFSNLTLKR
ncbi:hypothetical protein [Lysobacter sp. 1R34A]|uniref:hypothetical protein n=1 Tax=Lysobacter sp. 1R34A TaxID=3445786 RepID=UPI003EF05BD8